MAKHQRTSIVAFVLLASAQSTCTQDASSRESIQERTAPLSEPTSSGTGGTVPQGTACGSSWWGDLADPIAGILRRTGCARFSVDLVRAPVADLFDLVLTAFFDDSTVGQNDPVTNLFGP